MLHPIRSLCLSLAFVLASVTVANAQFITSNQAAGCAACANGNYGATGDKTQCGHYGLKIYPLSDQRYIKQFCQPTICPGSCFGVFKTQWNRWDQACPNWHAGNADAMVGYGNYSPNLNTNRNEPLADLAPATPKTPDTIPPATPKADVEPKIPPESSNPLPTPKKADPSDPRPSVPQSSNFPMPMPSEAVIPNANVEIPTAQPITLPPIPDVRIKH